MVRLCFLLWGVVLGLAVLPVASNAQDASTLRAELDSVYQKLLADPSDRALNRRLADIAIQLQDYDAAIGAVERLIFYEPSSAALQLEAAQLYMRIESYAAAVGYLQDALALDSITAAQYAEATQLLVTARRETRPSPWSGFGQIGARYQTNANHGSVALGIDEPLPFEKPVDDWNSFALGTLGLTLPVDENVTFEATVSGYYADQDKVDRLDLGFAEVNVGPRLFSENGVLEIKPYALAQGITLGGEPYQSAVGGGILVRWNVADGWWLEPQYELKSRTFYNSGDYPTATDNDGDLDTYAVNMNAQLSDNVNLTSRVAYNQNEAAKKYQSYDQYLAILTVEINFDLFGLEDWLLAPFVSGVISDFKGIAPTERFANLTTVRKDEQWSVGANLEIPVVDQVAIGLSIEYTKNDSNLSRNRFENWQVVIGPQGRF